MINRTDEDWQQVPIHFRRRAWLESEGITSRAVARALGVTPARFAVILRQESCPEKHVRVLRDRFGMPEDILPRPSRGKPGPPSKSERREYAFL
jgi:hypothetical protein